MQQQLFVGQFCCNCWWKCSGEKCTIPPFWPASLQNLRASNNLSVWEYNWRARYSTDSFLFMSVRYTLSAYIDFSFHFMIVHVLLAELNETVFHNIIVKPRHMMCKKSGINNGYYCQVLSSNRLRRTSYVTECGSVVPIRSLLKKIQLTAAAVFFREWRMLLTAILEAVHGRVNQNLDVEQIHNAL